MYQLAAFVVISASLVYISRASLKSPRSHGFYRFFAWECILALFLLNLAVWFQDPFSAHQLISWFLLILCIVPLVFGVLSLTSQGKAASQRAEDTALLSFEKTTVLITSGIYHYIRHPLYSSLLLLAWGIFFKAPSWPGVLLALAASLFLFATARADEAECIRYFGAPYQEFMKHTRRFIPFVF
ncbi:MAG: isoprenylcysteine carboxylmethyltransferase family protein [Anaerolineaceae bacterium]|nr:isoprenylcysteine carboxylmethyltransferase family protein [Anaerolineaceae bacterium]